MYAHNTYTDVDITHTYTDTQLANIIRDISNFNLFERKEEIFGQYMRLV